MIISASRRTDIPAFCEKWPMNHIRDGYCTVPNPFNQKQVPRTSLKRENIGSVLDSWLIAVGGYIWVESVFNHCVDRFGITASAVSHSIRKFRVKIERDRSLLKKIEKTEKRLKFSKDKTVYCFFPLNERYADNRSITCYAPKIKER